jgi:hypothetical protein
MCPLVAEFHRDIVSPHQNNKEKKHNVIMDRMEIRYEGAQAVVQ